MSSRLRVRIAAPAIQRAHANGNRVEAAGRDGKVDILRTNRHGAAKLDDDVVARQAEKDEVDESECNDDRYRNVHESVNDMKRSGIAKSCFHDVSSDRLCEWEGFWLRPPRDQ